MIKGVKNVVHWLGVPGALDLLFGVNSELPPQNMQRPPAYRLNQKRAQLPPQKRTTGIEGTGSARVPDCTV